MAWIRFPIAVVALLAVGSHALVPTKPLAATKLDPSVDYHASINDASGLRLPRPQGLYYQDRPVASNTSVARDGTISEFLKCELQYAPVTGQCKCGEHKFIIAVQEGDRGSDFGEWACPEALVDGKMAGRWVNYTMENVQHEPKVVQYAAGDEVACDEVMGCKPGFHLGLVNAEVDNKRYILQTWPRLECTTHSEIWYNVYKIRGFRVDSEALGGDDAQAVYDALLPCGTETGTWHAVHAKDTISQQYGDHYGRPSWRDFELGFNMNIGATNCVGHSLYEWSKRVRPEGLWIDQRYGWWLHDCFGTG